MNDRQRKALRASTLIHECLLHMDRGSAVIALPDSAWRECTRLAQQTAKARARGWHRAAGRLREHFAYAVSTCRRRLEELPCRLDTISQAARPTPRELFQDIAALEDEFDDVEVHLNRHTLSVTTEEVVLMDIDLGRFEIVLDWASLGHSRTYEVVALDPNPAASDPETTHPHAQGNQLCEGDGRGPIRQALKQGRLFDFFMLVRQTLETYNPASAYVSLEQWNGVECRDCGRLMAEDDRDSCEHCEAEVCRECSMGCTKCGRSCCSECAETCPGCDDSFCPDCLAKCAGCNESFCEECLTDDQCPGCLDAEEEQRRKVEKGPGGKTPAEAGPSRPSLQPARVGEALVPA